MNYQRVGFCVAVIAIIAVMLAFPWWKLSKSVEPLGQHGRFEGTLAFTWLEDGRRMSLMNDASYVDPDEHRWEAAEGTIVDGASIPRVFWTMIGSPFAGKYRAASVFHDVACVERTQSWREVHRMFFHASLAAGVDVQQAKIMYAAVYHFGPRWDGQSRLMQPTTGPPIAFKGFKQMSAEEQRLASYASMIQEYDPSLAEIEAFGEPLDYRVD